MTSPDEFLYTPMQDLQSRALASYFCISKHALLHQEASAEDLAMAMEEPQELAGADLETLRHVSTTLGGLLVGGVRCMLLLPVHFDTLATPKWRNAYVSLGLSLPKRMRPFLTIELCDLPEGVTQGRVLDMVGMLRPFTAAILARLSLSTKSFGVYAGTGLHAVGGNLDLARETKADPVGTLYRFATAARKVHLWTYLLGVRTPELAVAATTAGVRYVDGESASTREDAPRTLQRYNWEEFLAHVRQTP